MNLCSLRGDQGYFVRRIQSSATMRKDSAIIHSEAAMARARLCETSLRFQMTSQFANRELKARNSPSRRAVIAEYGQASAPPRYPKTTEVVPIPSAAKIAC